jgi:hypothetical protein
VHTPIHTQYFVVVPREIALAPQDEKLSGVNLASPALQAEEVGLKEVTTMRLLWGLEKKDFTTKSGGGL